MHLYPCEACGRHGLAHYATVADADGWFNVRLCAGCHAAVRTGAPAPEPPDQET